MTQKKRRCPHCHREDCPGRHGSPHYSNEDFDRCQDFARRLERVRNGYGPNVIMEICDDESVSDEEYEALRAEVGRVFDEKGLRYF